LPDDLQLIGLRSRAERGEADGRTALLTVQNLGPRRRRLTLPPGWRLLARVDGLDRPRADRPSEPGSDPLAIGPWQIGFWRLAGVDQSS
jgi:alpha-mannosidase